MVMNNNDDDVKKPMDKEDRRRAIRGKQLMVEEEEEERRMKLPIKKRKLFEMMEEEKNRKRRMTIDKTLPIKKRRMLVTEEVQERRRIMPEWLVDVMREVNRTDAKLILEKSLTATDVSKKHGRLLIPLNKIVDKEFLSTEELEIIDNHKRGICKKGLVVSFVDCRGKIWPWELNLRRWDMKSSSNYVLASRWNHVVDYNHLLEGDPMQLWSFRSPEGLYFAMAPLNAASSSTSAVVSVHDPYAASTSVTIHDPYVTSSSNSAPVSDPYATSSSNSAPVRDPFAASTSAMVQDPNAASSSNPAPLQRKFQ